MTHENIEQESPEVQRNYTNLFPQEAYVPAPSILLVHGDRFNSKEQLTLRGIITKFFRMIVDAAVTIFSVGVGVGMILGDTFRENARNMESTVHSDRTAGANDGSPVDIGLSSSLGERVLGVTRTTNLLPPQ